MIEVHVPACKERARGGRTRRATGRARQGRAPAHVGGWAQAPADTAAQRLHPDSRGLPGYWGSGVGDAPWNDPIVSAIIGLHNGLPILGRLQSQLAASQMVNAELSRCVRVRCPSESRRIPVQEILARRREHPGLTKVRV